MQVSSLANTDKAPKHATEDEVTIISFWKLNDKLAKGQQQCYRYMVEKDVIIRKITGRARNPDEEESSTSEAKKCLISGQNNKVFFFQQDKNTNIFTLNVIDETTSEKPAKDPANEGKKSFWGVTVS